MNPFTRALDVWTGFWFTPRSTLMITWIRILLGLTVLGWGLALVPDFDTFFFEDGLLLQPSYGTWRIGALRWLRDDWAAVAVLTTLLVSAALTAAGRFVRIAAPLMWYALMSLQQDITVMTNASDVLLRLWAFYYAVFAVLTPSPFLSVGPRGVRSSGERSWPVGPGWILRVFQIQLTAIYVATVIEKSPGGRWHDGTAASIALGLEEFERFWVPDLLRDNLLVGNLATWAAIGLEIVLPVLLWNRHTRQVAIIAGIGLHLGFDYAMRLGYFFPGMLIGYVSFMRPGDLGQITAPVTRGLHWVRSTSAVPRGEANVDLTP